MVSLFQTPVGQKPRRILSLDCKFLSIVRGIVEEKHTLNLIKATPRAASTLPGSHVLTRTFDEQNACSWSTWTPVFDREALVVPVSRIIGVVKEIVAHSPSKKRQHLSSRALRQAQSIMNSCIIPVRHCTHLLDDTDVPKVFFVWQLRTAEDNM